MSEKHHRVGHCSPEMGKGGESRYFSAYEDFLRQKLYLCNEPISVEGFVMLATTRKNAKTFLLRKLIDSYSPMECASPSVRRTFYRLKTKRYELSIHIRIGVGGSS